MAFLRTPKRQVPKPDVVGPHQSVNPMFAEDKDWSGFRARVLGWTVGMLALAAVGYLAYGPLLSITDVTVTGTRVLDPASVKRSAEQYLDGQRWLLFPNRTLWIVSSNGLAHYLRQQIQQRISIDQVTVVKKAPHQISISIAERTPVAIWTNGTIFGSVDKQGKIIEMRSGPDVSLPIVRDENENMFTVDASVVKQEVVTSLQVLVGEMKSANIQVKEYLIPVPVCPVPIVPVTNTNAEQPTNSHTTNANKNINVTNENANVSIPVAIPCDTEALRYSSQEIHAQLIDGPRVLFDRHSDLQQAVQALQRVLAEHTDKKYTSIDVRFGDRVYVK